MIKMEESGKIWTNLHICKVEDPQTIWLKEIPSPSMTTSLRNFQEMEIQMNEYYNFRKRKRMQRVPVVGEIVAVCQRDHWYRAKVKKVVNTSWSFRVAVFLLDHGEYIEVQTENVMEMRPGEWTSVEYQAFRVQLFGLVPISLKYSREVKVVYRKVGSWDPSAYEYVKKLFGKYKQAAFLPLGFRDVVQGFLFIRSDASPQDDLLPASVFHAQPCSPLQDALPEESVLFESPELEGLRHVNVLHVLVALGYATIDTEAFVKLEQEIKNGEVISIPKFPTFLHGREEDTQKQMEMTSVPEFKDWSQSVFMESETKASRKYPQMVNSTLEYPVLSSTESSISCEELDGNVHEGIIWQSKPVASTCDKVASMGNISSLQRDVSNLEISTRESSPHAGKNSSFLSTLDMVDLIKKQRSENKSLPPTNYGTEFSGVEVSEVSNTFAKDDCFSDGHSSGNICLKPDLFSSSKQKSRRNEEVMPDGVTQQHDWGDAAIPVPVVEGQQQDSRNLNDDEKQFINTTKCSPFMSLTSSFKQPPNFIAAEHYRVSTRAEKNFMVNKPIQKEMGDIVPSNVGAALDTEHCPSFSASCKDSKHNRESPFAKKSVKFHLPKVMKERGASVSSHNKLYEPVTKVFREKENRNIVPEFRSQNFTIPSEGILLKGIGSCLPKQNRVMDLSIKKDVRLKNEISSAVSEVIYPEGKVQTSKYLFPMMACKWDRRESSNVEEEEKSVVGVKTFVDCMNIKKEYEVPLLARLNRVFVAGDDAIGEEEVITNVDMSKAVLNSHIGRVVNGAELYVSRIQSYMWAALNKGISAIVVGGRRSGKTFGYLVPLISSLIDTAPVIMKRLPTGIGAMMIIICGTWRQVKVIGNHVSFLLPPSSSFRFMTAWGGQGHDEQDLLKKQLLNGCDILVSTLPFLMQALNGSMNNDAEGLCTTLNRCCYLVIDDAETVIENDPESIKLLLELFGQGRGRRKRFDDVQQIVVVGSQWTKLLDDLTCTLASLNPTVLISSHQEAAIAARVPTKVHFVQSEKMGLSKILCLIHEEDDGHILIFVRNEEVVVQLQEVLQSAAVHTMSIEAVPSTWELRRQIDMWRTSVSCSMLIPESAVPYLLLQDLRDASVIIHHYIPEKSKGLFTARYSFMMDRYSSVIGQKSLNCKSHILLTKETITMNAAVVKELKRMKAYIPQNVENIVLGITNDERKSALPLCYFLKAYGECKEQLCKWRHEVLLSDQPLQLPQEGDVEFELIEVINASCYLVRLINYRANAGLAFTSLKAYYLNLFLAMHQFFSVQDNQKVIAFPEVGLVCAVCHETVWTRAKILHVSYAMNVMQAHLFLLDDGLELAKNINEIYQLPEYLAAMPQLIVEVHLCCIRPLDKDREWTYNASQYIRTLFTAPQAGPAKRFVGKVALAIGHTLWLSPIVEMVQKGNTYLKLKAIRNQLLTEGYGQANDLHLKTLESACEKAGWKAKEDISRTGGWLESYREADERIRLKMSTVSSEENDDSKALQIASAFAIKTDDLLVTDRMVNSEEPSIMNELVAETGQETPNAKEFIAEIGEETSIINDFSAEIGEKTSSLNECSANIGEKTSITNECNANIGETVINELDAEAGEETAIMNEMNTEADEEAAITNELNTEISEEASIINKFSTEVGEETSSAKELDKEISGETSTADEFNAEMGVETSNAEEISLETGLQVNETSPATEEVDMRNSEENGRSDNTEDMLDVGRVGAVDSAHLKYEFLTVNEELTVEVTEVVSPQCFFVIKEEMFERLDSLEDHIHELTRNWGTECQDASDKLLSQPACDVPLGLVCLAQFTDNEFYRALLLEENPETKEKRIFFIDHGETMWLSENKVYECPVDLVDALPAQAIHCSLTPGQEDSVLHFDSEEVNLSNEGQICTIKVLAQKEQENPVYIVEVYRRSAILPSEGADKQRRLMESGENDASVGSKWAQQSCDTLITQVDDISLTDAVNFLSDLVGMKSCSKDDDKSFERITEIDNEDAFASGSPARCCMISEQLGDETGLCMIDHRGYAQKSMVTLPDCGQSIVKLSHNEDTCKVTEMVQEVLQSQTNGEDPEETENESGIKDSYYDVTESKRTVDMEGNEERCALQGSKNYEGGADELELRKLSEGELQEDEELNNVLLKSKEISSGNGNKHNSEKLEQDRQTENGMAGCEEIHHDVKPISEIGQDLKKSTCIKKKTKYKSGEVSRAMTHQKEAAHLDWSGPSLQAVDAVTPGLKPMAAWYQNISKVVLKLDLAKVSLYQCRFSSKHILFRTLLADRYYELNERLHGILNPDLCSVEVHPAYVLIIIVKHHQGMWRRLLHGGDKVAWLNVDWNMVEMESSSDEEEETGDLTEFFTEAKPSLNGGRPAGISDENGSSSESCDSNDSDFYKIS